MKWLRYRPFIFGASLLLLWIGYLLFSAFLIRTIEGRIKSINGKAFSVDVSLIKRSLKINQFEWNPLPNSDSSHFSRSVNVKHIYIEGIQLYALLFSDRIVVTKISLDSGTVIYHQNADQKQAITSKYKSLLIKEIAITDLATRIYKDTSSSFSALVNCRLGTIKVNLDSIDGFDYSMKEAEVLVEKVRIDDYEGLYGGKIASIKVSLSNRQIIIDSTELIPNFDKFEFAHQAGKQTSRISLLVPKITIDNLQFDRLADSSFIASRIRIASFDLYAFRDKRIPFLRDQPVPLPMESFLKLPYFIKVDSIIISNSLITIEEFPEDAITAGTLTFNEVNATLVGLDNRPEAGTPIYAQLRATALLMNEGKTEVLFQLPLDGVSVYTTKGSISNINIKNFNSMLIAQANVRIESGYLNKLSFDFGYNDFVSKGNTDIDYQDLHVIGLNTNKRSTNEFKTFLINTFVKRDRSKSVLSARKNGVIDIERDRKRYIFNLWAKSILGGVKSTLL